MPDFAVYLNEWLEKKTKTKTMICKNQLKPKDQNQAEKEEKIALSQKVLIMAKTLWHT